MDNFEEQFLSTEEGASRLAVKRLTKKLEMEMMRITISAFDWESLVAAKMAREMLYDKKQVAPEAYVNVSQT